MARLEKNYAEEGTFELWPNAEVQAQVETTSFMHNAGGGAASSATGSLGATDEALEQSAALPLINPNRRPSIVTEEEAAEGRPRQPSIIAVPVSLEAAKFGTSLSSLHGRVSLSATPTERSPLLVPAAAPNSSLAPSKQPNGAVPLPTYTPADLV